MARPDGRSSVRFEIDQLDRAIPTHFLKSCCRGPQSPRPGRSYSADATCRRNLVGNGVERADDAAWQDVPLVMMAAAVPLSIGGWGIVRERWSALSVSPASHPEGRSRFRFCLGLGNLIGGCLAACTGAYGLGGRTGCCCCAGPSMVVARI